jgi:hypothetical protein
MTTNKKQPEKTHFQEVCKLGLSSPLELDGFCEHGLARARWCAENHNSSSAEELSARGCPYFVISEDEDGYCFFKMASKKSFVGMEEEDIGKRLGINVNQVRTILARALMKIKGTEFHKELEELRKEGCLYEDNHEEDLDMYFVSTDGNFFDEVGLTGDGEISPEDVQASRE